MDRPHALLRAGFPYLTTVGMRRVTNGPVDLAIGNDGRIHILCRDAPAGGLIRTLTLDDDDLGVISGSGTDDGKFTWPVCLAMDDKEDLYVSDEALHQITKLSKDGEFLGKWGEHGQNDGQLNRPSGIAFDTENNIYVSDTLNHRIQKFTEDGRFLLKWGEYGNQEGQLNMPWGIAVDELGDVYVVDWRNDRIQKFNSQGEFIFALGRPGNGDGEFNHPTGVEVDRDGDIYVADCSNNRIQLFSPEGRYVEQFIGDASLSKSARKYMMSNAKTLRMREMVKLGPQKRLREPKSVKVDNEGRMYITDSKSFRVQVYQKDVIPLDSSQIVAPLRSPTIATA